jgi:flavodoxin
MNILVIYYSRTGNTKFVAEKIAETLGAELKELIDKKNRKGFWGYLRAGRDSIMKVKTEIEELNIDLDKYELVFLGCPVWVANVPPAIRTYLDRTDLVDKKLVLFCTQDGMGAERVFNNLRHLARGAQIVGEKYFNKVNLNKEVAREQVKNWLEELKKKF